MRKKEKEITDRSEMDAIIRKSHVCRLALSLNDAPYLVPLCFGYDGKSIYVHTGRTGKKIDYFEGNRRVCFEFEQGVKPIENSEKACKWSFSYQSVIGYGTIYEIRDPGKKEEGLNQIMLHYSGKSWPFDATIFQKTRIWEIRIEAMTGKRS